MPEGDGNLPTDSFAMPGGGLQIGAACRAALRGARQGSEPRGERDGHDRARIHGHAGGGGLARALAPHAGGLPGERDGPDFHRFGNRVRYRRSDLDAWAAKRRAATTAEADRLRAG